MKDRRGSTLGAEEPRESHGVGEYAFGADGVPCEMVCDSKGKGRIEERVPSASALAEVRTGTGGSGLRQRGLGKSVSGLKRY